MWLIVLWIAIAALGVAASFGTLWQSTTFSRFLKENDQTKHLVYAYRIEIFRDLISLSVQSINLLIGLLAMVTFGHSNHVVGIITTVGLMFVAVLLMVRSITVYRIRHQKAT